MQKTIAVVFILLGSAIAMPSFVSAGTITIGIANETAPINGATGGTGSFDVVISEPGGGNSLYAYQFDLFVQQGASNIQFVGYDQSGQTAPSGYSNIEDTVAPYVFAGNSLESGYSDVFVYGPGPDGNEVVNSDEGFTGQALSDTQLALAHVVFTVPAGTAAGSYALTFNANNPNVDLYADWVNTVAVADLGNFPLGATINGAIVVTPEPAAVVLLAFGSFGLLLAARRRR